MLRPRAGRELHLLDGPRVHSGAVQAPDRAPERLPACCLCLKGPLHAVDARPTFTRRCPHRDTHLLRRAADPPDDGEAGDDQFLEARRQLEEEGSDSGEDDEDEGEALVIALSLLASHPDAAERDASRALLLKAATNLTNDPSNPKFRRLRKQNKIIDAKVVKVKGAPEVLACMGFEDAGDEWVVRDDDVFERAAAVAAALKM